MSGDVPARGRGRARAVRGNDDGFTLFEVLIAIVLVSALLISTSQLVISQTRIAGDDQYSIVAANLANQTIEADEEETFSTLIANAPPSGTPYTQTQTVGSITYKIVTNTYWQPEATTAGGCDNSGNGNGSGLADILLVEVTVSWGMAGQDTSRADTLITPPVTNSSGSEVNIALQVEGPAPANAPMVNVPVQVSGPSGSTTYYTDSNGCLFLGYQAPGSYTFTVTQPTWSVGDAWVNNDEQPTATVVPSPVSILSGTYTALLNYSQGGTIVANFTGASPAPIGLPITVSNSNLTAVSGNPNSASGLYTYPGGSTSVSSTSLTPLWPYSNVYGVFAGHCPEANPSAVNSSNQALYPSLTQSTVAVTANQTSTVNVPLYPLTVKVTSQTGKPVAGYTAVLNEQPGSAKSACAQLNSYNLVGLTAGAGTGTLTAGIPLGTFTVSLLQGGSPVMCGLSACVSNTFDNTGSASTATVSIP